MAICREFYFPSSDGSSRIHAAEWTPESGEIIGVLQIAHGVAEYGMRYAPFAEFMTEHGFAVVANDHLGHGLSAEKDADTLYFGPRDGWKHVVDDMYALRCRTKEKYPDVPYFLMGHSMGSFLTRTYLIRYPGTVDAAIIMGTGHQSPAIVAGGRAIAKARASATASRRTLHAWRRWLSVLTTRRSRPTAQRSTGSARATTMLTPTLPTLSAVRKRASASSTRCSAASASSARRKTSRR